MTRIAIFSDVHGNLPALDEFLNDSRDNVDLYVCLGDIVGYGGKPNECVDIVRDVADVVVYGNHDNYSSNGGDLSTFNSRAAESVLRTRDLLSGVNKDYLLGLPRQTVYEGDLEICLNHNCPNSTTTNWGYLNDQSILGQAFSALQQKLAFIGHSHIPDFYLFCSKTQEELFASPERELPVFLFDEENPIHINGYFDKAIFNVGSVGQPRDGDNRGSYVVFDTVSNLVELHRFSYDIDSSMRHINCVGMPKDNADRLLDGR